ncbi:hypothetical protein QBC35DRAFT_447986 [Podospora australis]|uniref:Uncharacterized protein n=1 Tax=Podospora australis TaxID=1536484 RepID=A0AAN6X215_9PEZI|nr:hypothetical protein QBC35DRAFT_447986 [Podospora australis]
MVLDITPHSEPPPERNPWYNSTFMVPNPRPKSALRTTTNYNSSNQDGSSSGQWSQNAEPPSRASESEDYDGVAPEDATAIHTQRPTYREHAHSPRYVSPRHNSISGIAGASASPNHRRRIVRTDTPTQPYPQPPSPGASRAVSPSQYQYQHYHQRYPMNTQHDNPKFENVSLHEDDRGGGGGGGGDGGNFFLDEPSDSTGGNEKGHRHHDHSDGYFSSFSW